LEEIAKKFGISKEMGRQRKERALRKAHWRVRDYLDDQRR
jgi:DNA-directed RNA polymerase sigma subunit (sigma70/sigma32)